MTSTVTFPRKSGHSRRVDNEGGCSDDAKADAVHIVVQSGKTVHQVAKEMGLTESALRRWVKQAQIDQHRDPQGQLTSSERKELNELRRNLKRFQMERDFLTAGALSGEPRQRTAPKKQRPSLPETAQTL